MDKGKVKKMDAVNGSPSEINLMPMISMVDKKSRVWPAPICYHSIDLAKREVIHAAKYGKDIGGRPPLFSEYPDDFMLVKVGVFDVSSGAIFPCNEKVAEVSEILSKE